MIIDVLRKKYKANMSVIVYQRNRSNRNNTYIGYTYTHMCVYIYIYICVCVYMCIYMYIYIKPYVKGLYFKQLAHRNVVTGKSEI